MRWKGLHDFAEDIDQTMEKMSEKEEVDVKIHLGGNIYLSVDHRFSTVDSFGDLKEKQMHEQQENI